MYTIGKIAFGEGGTVPSSPGDILNGYDELPNDLKEYIPNFEYVLYNLKDYTDEDIKGAAQTRIALTLLRDIFVYDTDQFLESFTRSLVYLHEVEDKQKGIEYFETMIKYIVSAHPNLRKEDVTKVMQRIEENYQDGSEWTMTLAEIWKAEGMEKGLEQGKANAISEIALLQLTNKFGALPKEMKECIIKADSTALQVLLTNIFTIEHLDDVRKYIQ